VNDHVQVIGLATSVLDHRVGDGLHQIALLVHGASFPGYEVVARAVVAAHQPQRPLRVVDERCLLHRAAMRGKRRIAHEKASRRVIAHDEEPVRRIDQCWSLRRRVIEAHAVEPPSVVAVRRHPDERADERFDRPVAALTSVGEEAQVLG
jgi:hypothetical protein